MAIIDMYCEMAGAKRADVRCDICGEQAVAHWLGTRDIFVCRECACAILPRLIADAVVQDDVRRAASIQYALLEIVKEFWRGAFHSVMRATKGRHSSADQTIPTEVSTNRPTPQRPGTGRAA